MLGVDIGTTYEPSLMSWGTKSNKVKIKVVFAAFVSGFIPTLILATRGCHGRSLGA